MKRNFLLALGLIAVIAVSGCIFEEEVTNDVEERVIDCDLVDFEMEFSEGVIWLRNSGDVVIYAEDWLIIEDGHEIPMEYIEDYLPEELSPGDVAAYEAKNEIVEEIEIGIGECPETMIEEFVV